MADEPKDTETPKPDEATAEQSEKDKAMSRIADEAAGKGRKTNQRYDQQRGTFPRGGPSGMS
jgi:hypothetical protein